MKLRIAVGALGVLLAASAAAQTKVAPAFEVASVKESGDVNGFMGVRFMPGGRVSIQGSPVKLILQVAFGVKAFQIVGEPAWADTQRYDITAKAEAGGSPTDVGNMLQNLLEERFKLKYRREKRTMAANVLAVAKNGLKLAEPKEGGCLSGPPPQGLPKPGDLAPCGSVRIGPEGITGSRIDMARLTNVLADILGQPVVDQTGFSGTFDVKLQFARDQATQGGVFGAMPQGPGGAPPAADSGLPTIFAALQEQLGLKLTSGKEPVDVIVVEAIERPSKD